MGKWFAWLLRRENRVDIGIGHIVGGPIKYKLSKEIMEGLCLADIHALNQAIEPHQDQIFTHWRDVSSIGIHTTFGNEWDNYTRGINREGFTLSHDEDILI